jgi:hypothetical protein
LLTSTFFEREPAQIPAKPPPTWVNLDNVSLANITLDSFLENKKIVHFIEKGNM